jgi:adenine-specific DNA methylase
LRKFSGYEGINSKTSDFAAAISNNFSKADPQILQLSGGYRPKSDIEFTSALVTIRFPEVSNLCLVKTTTVFLHIAEFLTQMSISARSARR